MMIRHFVIRTFELCVCAIALALVSACSTYNMIGDAFKAPPQAVPQVDLTKAKWQKLSPAQPDANPLRVALIQRDEKIGATRVVLKAPPGFTLPAYWLSARGTYTVLKGTFVFDTLDADGKPQKLVQPPGSFDLIPPSLIQRTATKPGDEGLLYITVYGEWAPNFADGAWMMQTLRAGS